MKELVEEGEGKLMEHSGGGGGGGASGGGGGGEEVHCCWYGDSISGEGKEG